MEALSAWERRNVIVFLQKLQVVPGLGTLMHLIGHVGTGEVLVTFFAFLYWCLDRNLCNTGIWLVPLAEISNGIIKWTFQQPRPGWVDRNIDIRSVSHEYSFPSSHAMIISSLAAFFTLMRPELGMLPMGVCTIVCISRVYEGAHYPKDVLVGVILGALLGGTHASFHKVILAWLEDNSISAAMRIVLGLIFTFLVGLLLRQYYIMVHNKAVPSAWNSRNGLKKDMKLDPYHVPYANYIAMCGVLSGLSIAQPLFSPLPLPISLLQHIARFSFGLIVLLGTFLGIRVVEKSFASPRSLCATVLRFCRYGSVPPVILLLVPSLARLLGI